MASIDKHGADTLYFIRHNVRQLPPEKAPSNLEIDPERTKDNTSLVKRWEHDEKRAKEINDYRKKIEDEIFHYNRKDLVRSVEVVITLPADCPPEQEEAFFKESYNYVVSTLPMGEKCVFLAEVHRDEGKIQKDGVTVIESPPHMHIMYVPGVPDTKHDGYDFKLCADHLTKRAQLKQFHPKFQKWLDDAGIKATVHSGVTGGQNVSVSELKQLTKETGLTLTEVKELQKDKNLLLDKLQENDQKTASLEAALQSKDATISILQSGAAQKDRVISDLSEKLSAKEAEISSGKEKAAGRSEEIERLQKQLKTKEQENEQLRSSARHIIEEKNQQIEALTSEMSEKDKTISDAVRQQDEMQRKVKELEAQLKSKEEELQAERQKTKVVQNDVSHNATPQTEVHSWGENGSWGHREGWGNQDKTKEVEKVW
ncbi:MAG: hypothetical protein K6E63_07165 [Lachnospiraceae bacterium]|nr:hypothetical protein [Lachnospiraceae bacterium]